MNELGATWRASPSLRTGVTLLAVRTLVIVVALGVLGSSVRPVEAQTPSASEMAAARDLFRSGLAHAEAGRWASARADFERSYRLARVPVTLFNLAGAQAETGALVAAAESYRSFLQVANEGRAARYRRAAEQALADLEPRIPSLRIEAPGLAEGDVLRIDDDVVSRAALGVAFRVDPGEHRVEILRGERSVVRETLYVAAGGERALTLVVPSLDTRPEVVARDQAGRDTLTEAPLATNEPTRERRSLARSPWLWVAVGVVVIAGATTAVVLATRGDDAPYQGNAGVIRFDLGRSR